MKNIEYMIGGPDLCRNPLMPFGQEALEFMSDLSKALLQSPVLRTYPDIASLAFWCRKANLHQMASRCPEHPQRLGRGVCFHIAPGNVPINFAFSYLFGVLSGCSNIVRLPSKKYPQTEPVCRIIKQVLDHHPEIKSRTAFVRYPADQEITSYFSAQADARVIWGGDKTVGAVKSCPSMPRCVDICFADRYSICILSGAAVLNAEDTQMRQLAEDFYNDTYLMDQNACSSPQIVFWLDGSPEAKNRFWTAVWEAAKQRYVLQPAVSVDKYAKLCEDELNMDFLGDSIRHTNLLYRTELTALKGDLTQLRGKGGYFYEYDLTTLDELTDHITEKYQTVTTFGMDREYLQNFVLSHHLRGIDRIVPVGKAMNIGILWDGYDIVRSLSRLVSLD